MCFIFSRFLTAGWSFFPKHLSALCSALVMGVLISHTGREVVPASEGDNTRVECGVDAALVSGASP